MPVSCHSSTGPTSDSVECIAAHRAAACITSRAASSSTSFCGPRAAPARWRGRQLPRAGAGPRSRSSWDQHCHRPPTVEGPNPLVHRDPELSQKLFGPVDRGRVRAPAAVVSTSSTSGGPSPSCGLRRFRDGRQRDLLNHRACSGTRPAAGRAAAAAEVSTARPAVGEPVPALRRSSRRSQRDLLNHRGGCETRPPPEPAASARGGDLRQASTSAVERSWRDAAARCSEHEPGERPSSPPSTGGRPTAEPPARAAGVSTSSTSGGPSHGACPAVVSRRSAARPPSTTVAARTRPPLDRSQPAGGNP